MLFLLISLSTFYLYFILKTFKAINVLDKEKFSTKKYFKEIFKNPAKYFGTLELFFIVLIIVALCTNAKVAGICTVLFYMILCLLELKKREKLKLKANNVRVFIITLLLFAALNVPIMIDSYNYQNSFASFDPTFIYYSILYIIMYLLWFIVGVSSLINSLFTKKASKKSK